MGQRNPRQAADTLERLYDAHGAAIYRYLLGKMARLVSVSRFCRTMSTLLVSGVPIVSALKITEAVVGNVVIGEAVTKASESIQEGQSIAVVTSAGTP